MDNAFDLWLQRGLHQLYDQVAQEPLPAELLRLIEEDRARSTSGNPPAAEGGAADGEGGRD